jgi:hypothetical protein
MLPLSLANAGGWGAMQERLGAEFFSWDGIGVQSIVTYFVIYTLGLLIGQDVWQRVFTARSPRVAQIGGRFLASEPLGGGGVGSRDRRRRGTGLSLKPDAPLKEKADGARSDCSSPSEVTPGASARMLPLPKALDDVPDVAAPITTVVFGTFLPEARFARNCPDLTIV